MDITHFGNHVIQEGPIDVKTLELLKNSKEYRNERQYVQNEFLLFENEAKRMLNKKVSFSKSRYLNILKSMEENVRKMEKLDNIAQKRLYDTIYFPNQYSPSTEKMKSVLENIENGEKFHTSVQKRKKTLYIDDKILPLSLENLAENGVINNKDLTNLSVLSPKLVKTNRKVQDYTIKRLLYLMLTLFVVFTLSSLFSYDTEPLYSPRRNQALTTTLPKVTVKTVYNFSYADGRKYDVQNANDEFKQMETVVKKYRNLQLSDMFDSFVSARIAKTNSNVCVVQTPIMWSRYKEGTFMGNNFKEKEFIEKVSSCEKNPLTEFIVTPLTLFAVAEETTAHANLLFYNKVQKQFERFDPNGQVQYIDKDGNDKYATRTLHKYLDKISKKRGMKMSVDYSLPVQLIGEDILQNLSFGGLCNAYTYWYLEARIQNPHMDISTLNKHIANLTKNDPKVILRYLKEIVESFEENTDTDLIKDADNLHWKVYGNSKTKLSELQQILKDTSKVMNETTSHVLTSEFTEDDSITNSDYTSTVLSDIEDENIKSHLESNRS